MERSNANLDTLSWFVEFILGRPSLGIEDKVFLVARRLKLVRVYLASDHTV